MSERRRTRSDVPNEALLFLLRAVAEREPIDAIAIADEGGRLVAGISGSTDGFSHLEGLAASARAVASGDEGGDAPEGDLFAFEVPVDDRRFYLASLGARPRALLRTNAAVKRILSRVVVGA